MKRPKKIIATNFRSGGLDQINLVCEKQRALMAKRTRREARTLSNKALASLRCGLGAFNSFHEDGRLTTTLLHLQHASEMLLKAALVQKQIGVFDRQKGTSIGFDKCVNLASQVQTCRLSQSDAGTLRAIDSLRDAEQHWFVVVEEELLYLHVRALVTIFDEVLYRVFEDRLADHLPPRVFPVSTLPPRDFNFLVDSEYRQITDLLQPGRRRRDEARGRIRTLLAMEAHVAEEVAVSEKDIDRIERAIKLEQAWPEVFPRLTSLQVLRVGEGAELTVRFSKIEGAPVRFIAADDPEEAAAVRQVDLQRKYRYSATELARHIDLTLPRSKALREHLGIDDDIQCLHVFEFGKMKLPRYSDRTIQRMREALAEVDMDVVWDERRGRGRARR